MLPGNAGARHTPNNEHARVRLGSTVELQGFNKDKELNFLLAVVERDATYRVKVKDTNEVLDVSPDKITVNYAAPVLPRTARAQHTHGNEDAAHAVDSTVMIQDLKSGNVAAADVMRGVTYRVKVKNTDIVLDVRPDNFVVAQFPYDQDMERAVIATMKHEDVEGGPVRAPK